MDKRIKRFLSLALALVLVVGLIPVSFASAEEETDANPNVNYRWEIGTDDEGNPALVDVTGGIYTENEFTKSDGSVTSDGALSALNGSFATPIQLLPTEEWVVEWKVTNWKTSSKAFLSEANGFSKSYIYYNDSKILAIGRSSSGYWNMGFLTTGDEHYDHDTTIDMTAEHVFRLENRLNDDDTNSVWLVLDGVDFHDMTSGVYKGSTWKGTENAWLSGATLNFGYIVSMSCDKLEYLAVYENGADCSHDYSEWTVSADGKKLERTCKSCGESESKDYYGYRWEMDTTTNTLESIVTGENLINELDSSSTITDGMLSNYTGKMTTPVTLLPTEEWVIEWQSRGEWNGMLLSSHSSGATGSVYLYQHNPYSTGLLSFGTYSGNYENTGIDISAIDQNTVHIFRIENRIDQNGVAMAYLIVDNIEVGAMENYRIKSGTSTGTSTAIYNMEGGLTFNYVGGNVYKPTDMYLDYLQIWPNGTTHRHTYTGAEAAGSDCLTVGETVYTCSCGDTYSVENDVVGDHIFCPWYESADGTQLCRECLYCGESETDDYKAYLWQMNTSTNALDSIVEGIFAENKLTIDSGSIDEGVLNMVKGSFAESIVLKPDKQWVIEWKSSGAWNTYSTDYGGVFLANGTSSYMYYNAKNIFALGHKNGDFYNYGFKTSDTATTIDMSVEHVFRLENRVSSDGTNEVWLVLDGVDFFNMNSQCYAGSNPSSEADNWLDGGTLTFTGIGNSLAGVNGMDLEYLKIYLNSPSVAAVCDETTESITGYSNLDAAVAASNSIAGSEIWLMADTSIDSLTLMNENSLYLNGYTLTVSGSVKALSGCHIYDRPWDGGLLKVDRGNLMVQSDNFFLPVWNGTDGYVFAWCSNINTKTAVDYENGTAVYYFQPLMEEFVHDYLAAGSDASGVKLCVTVSFKVDGEDYSKTFNCKDELIAQFYANYEEKGEHTLAFKLSLTGVDKVDEGSLTFGVSFVGNGVTYECHQAY